MRRSAPSPSGPSGSRTSFRGPPGTQEQQAEGRRRDQVEGGGRGVIGSDDASPREGREHDDPAGDPERQAPRRRRLRLLAVSRIGGRTGRRGAGVRIGPGCDSSCLARWFVDGRAVVARDGVRPLRRVASSAAEAARYSSPSWRYEPGQRLKQLGVAVPFARVGDQQLDGLGGHPASLEDLGQRAPRVGFLVGSAGPERGEPATRLLVVQTLRIEIHWTTHHTTFGRPALAPAVCRAVGCPFIARTA